MSGAVRKTVASKVKYFYDAPGPNPWVARLAFAVKGIDVCFHAFFFCFFFWCIRRSVTVMFVCDFGNGTDGSVDKAAQACRWCPRQSNFGFFEKKSGECIGFSVGHTGPLMYQLYLQVRDAGALLATLM